MTRDDLTIIYYTANREDEVFEAKIRAKLLEQIGDMPLISVSQKPIENFGTNICVGEQPYCDATAHRQLLIGLEAATTAFCIAAESDCIYPPEYFTFIPPTLDNVYRLDNIWLLFGWHGRQTKGLFWKKPLCEGAQMCGREQWITSLKYALRGINGWELKRPPLVFKTRLQYSWTSENPVVSFKSRNGLRKFAGTYKADDKNPASELPYWGTANDLRKEFFNQ